MSNESFYVQPSGEKDPEKGHFGMCQNDRFRRRCQNGSKKGGVKMTDFEGHLHVQPRDDNGLYKRVGMAQNGPFIGVFARGLGGTNQGRSDMDGYGKREEDAKCTFVHTSCTPRFGQYWDREIRVI